VLTYKKVTRAGFSILHYLILSGGSLMPTVISKKTTRSKYSVTRVVDTLEKIGLVRRLPLGEDRRIRRVIITNKGLETVRNATLASREQICRDIFGNLDARELDGLDNSLRQVRKRVHRLIDAANSNART
jgi:DNA-binding MarR family transcriptional regulator